jgi:hypothetical protein
VIALDSRGVFANTIPKLQTRTPAQPEHLLSQNTCSATHVHEEGPATSWNTSTSHSLNSRVESVWYVVQVKLVSLEKNLVYATCKLWSIFVAHEPAFPWR